MGDSIFRGEGTSTWHVYWQGAQGRDLLGGFTLVDRIRGRLLRAHDVRGRTLLYYLLTPTEIHVLTILSEGRSSSVFAHGVANVVARWVREYDAIRGPVFAGRYQVRAIESAAQLCEEVRMLAWRPVSMGLCRAATHYAHSALREVLGLSRLRGFNPSALHAVFGATTLEARFALRRSIAERPSEMAVTQWELVHGLSLATGQLGPTGAMSREVGGAAALLVAASEPPGIEGALQLLERWVQVKLRVEPVGNLACRRDHGAARARALVANLAVHSGLCSAAAVARYFSRSKATLSEQMAAGRRRPADRQILDLSMEQIASEAVALVARC